jgi:hypothetical protein
VLVPNGPGRQIDLSGSGTGDWYVSWSLAVANDADNAISVSPASSGTLTPADSTTTVTITADQFVPCGSPQSPTITVSPGGAVFSVCTSPSRHTGDGDSARVGDALARASSPARKPAEYRAATLARLRVGGHHGRTL